MTLRPQILHLTRRLAEPIPDPTPKQPKPQRSWRTLTVGRQLESTQPYEAGQIHIAEGERVEVAEVDSAGVTVYILGSVPARFRIESREWGQRWRKVRRKPSRKPKGKS